MTTGSSAIAINGSPPPSLKRLWGFFWPLAVSDISTSIIQPMIMAGLARSAQSTYALTVYGTAFSIVVLLESPVIMILHAANALAHDTERFRIVRNYTVLLVGVSLGILVLLGYSRPGLVILQSLMGLDEALARDTADTLRLFLIWPLFVGWKRLCQGVLIHLQKTGVVGFGTALRLAIVAALVIYFVAIGGGLNIWSASLILILAMSVEALIATIAIVQVMRQHQLAVGAGVELRLSTVHQFYVPLFFTTIVMVMTRPIMIAGLARLQDPAEAIAVWSVVFSVTMLFSNHGRGFLNLVITLGNTRAAFEKIGRFGLVVGVVSSMMLAAIGATPLGTWFLLEIMGIEPELITPVQIGALLTSLVPFLRVFQNRARGALINANATRLVNTIALVNVAVMVSGSAAIAVFQLPGVAAAAAVFALAYLSEVGVLEQTVKRRRALPANWEPKEVRM